MQSLPVLAELPSGTLIEAAQGEVYAWHPRHARALRAAGFEPGREVAWKTSTLTGRKPLFELEAGGEALVLRRFSHGGLLRWLTGERFRDAERPFREMALSGTLTEHGIPTPLIVAARALRMRSFGYRLELVSKKIPDAIDLGFVLASVGRDELPLPVARELLRSAGAFVQRLHASGFLHADLNPNNLLVQRAALEGEAPKFWVLDLDRSRIVDEVGPQLRRDNLRRLFRFVDRRNPDFARPLSRTDIARFCQGYDPGGEVWKGDWRSIERVHTRSWVSHGGGWWLERLFGRRQDPRYTDPRA